MSETDPCLLDYWAYADSEAQYYEARRWYVKRLNDIVEYVSEAKSAELEDRYGDARAALKNIEATARSADASLSHAEQVAPPYE